MPKKSHDEQRTVFKALIPEITRIVNDGSRDSAMVEQLLEALALFKQNRLARAVPVHTPNDLVFGKALLKRRRQIFRGLLKARGETAIMVEFYEKLSTRTRNVCMNLLNRDTETQNREMGTFIPLHHLAQLSTEDIVRYRNAGAKVAGEIELALNAYGLYLGMPEVEIQECFRE